MGQEPTSIADGQEPLAVSETTAAPQDGDGTQPKTFDEDYVKSLRAEAAKHRKEAAEAKARAQQLEDAQLSETEKLKKDAEEGKALAAQATAKLQQANLRDALAEKGFSGPQAKAVARLLDGVEYDADDEPKNLDVRLEAAAREYGDLVQPGTTTTFDGGARHTAPPPQTAQQKHTEILRAALSGQLQTT